MPQGSSAARSSATSPSSHNAVSARPTRFGTGRRRSIVGSGGGGASAGAAGAAGAAAGAGGAATGVACAGDCWGRRRDRRMRTTQSRPTASSPMTSAIGSARDGESPGSLDDRATPMPPLSPSTPRDVVGVAGVVPAVPTLFEAPDGNAIDADAVPSGAATRTSMRSALAGTGNVSRYRPARSEATESKAPTSWRTSAFCAKPPLSAASCASGELTAPTAYSWLRPVRSGVAPSARSALSGTVASAPVAAAMIAMGRDVSAAAPAASVSAVTRSWP